MINDHHYVRTTLAYSNSKNTFYENKYLTPPMLHFTKIPMSMTTSTAFTLHSYVNSKFSARISSKVGVTLDNRQLISTVDDRGLGFDFDQDGQADLLRIRNINGNVTTVEPYANLKIPKAVTISPMCWDSMANSTPRPPTCTGTQAGHQLQREWHICLQPGLWPAQPAPTLPVFFLLIPDDQQNFVVSNQNLDFTRPSFCAGL